MPVADVISFGSWPCERSTDVPNLRDYTLAPDNGGSSRSFDKVLSAGGQRCQLLRRLPSQKCGHKQEAAFICEPHFCSYSLGRSD
jgi:hypothetical protein